MSVSINGTGGITFADASTQSTGGYTGFRNRIINGAMMIDQRNAGASVTVTATSIAQYVLDRWYLRAESATGSKVSVQRSTVAPAGFINSQLVTSLSAYTVGSAEHFGVNQVIEGLNVADLGWGTANAQAVTLSFKVRSSLTGTFGVMISNESGSRSYIGSYTINSANTFEDKVIVIPGDTSGTWRTDNGGGITVSFSVGAGSSVTTSAGVWNNSFYRSVTGQTSLVGTNGATFYITGVQLEKGSVATPFEFRPYGTELQLCQRYYYQVKAGSDSYCQFGMGRAYSGTAGNGIIPFAVPMRSSPTFAYLGTVSNYDFSPTSINSGAVDAGYTHMTVGMGFTSITSGSIYIIGQNAASTPCGFTFSAEL